MENELENQANQVRQSGKVEGDDGVDGYANANADVNVGNKREGSRIETSSTITGMATPIPISVAQPMNGLMKRRFQSNNQYIPSNPSPLGACFSESDGEDQMEEKSRKDANDENVDLYASKTRNKFEQQVSIKKSYSISNNNIDSVEDGRVTESPTTTEDTNISTIGDTDSDLDLGTLGKYRKKIPLFLHGDHVLVFNSRHMKELTIKYGITGQLAGTLPLAPQQNLLLGFPWRLSIYEVLWLIYEGICELVDSQEIFQNGYLAYLSDDNEIQEELVQNLQNKLDKWRDEKQKEIEEQLKKLNIIKKDKKVMKPLDNLMLTSSASMPDLQQVLNDTENKEREMKEKKRKEREMQEKSKRNKIVFMETTNDDYLLDKLWDRLNTSVDQRKLLARLLLTHVQSGESTDTKLWMNFLMFKYFKTSLGYYVLPGMRFGGTYVTYPGDPLRYHAHQIVETKEYYSEDIGLFKMCNRGRLATGVRKVWVVGGNKVKNTDSHTRKPLVDRILDKDETLEDEMVCFSIEWSGF